jgi:outer membrane protein
MRFASKTIAFCVVGLWFVTGFSQFPQASGQQGQPAAGSMPLGVLKIAVVDLEKVGKQHENYQKSIKAIQEEWTAANAQLQKRQEALNQMQVKLQSMRPGTPEYTKLQQELITAQTTFSGDLQKTQLELQEKDAALHAAMYQLTHRVIKQYADAKGLGLVIQHKTIPVATAEVQQVSVAMSQLVLYHRAPDITDIISREVNRHSLDVGK